MLVTRWNCVMKYVNDVFDEKKKAKRHGYDEKDEIEQIQRTCNERDMLFTVRDGFFFVEEH